MVGGPDRRGTRLPDDGRVAGEVPGQRCDDRGVIAGGPVAVLRVAALEFRRKDAFRPCDPAAGFLHIGEIRPGPCHLGRVVDPQAQQAAEQLGDEVGVLPPAAQEAECLQQFHGTGQIESGGPPRNASTEIGGVEHGVRDRVDIAVAQLEYRWVRTEQGERQYGTVRRHSVIDPRQLQCVQQIQLPEGNALEAGRITPGDRLLDQALEFVIALPAQPLRRVGARVQQQGPLVACDELTVRGAGRHLSDLVGQGPVVGVVVEGPRPRPGAQPDQQRDLDERLADEQHAPLVGEAGVEAGAVRREPGDRRAFHRAPHTGHSRPPDESMPSDPDRASPGAGHPARRVAGCAYAASSATDGTTSTYLSQAST